MTNLKRISITTEIREIFILRSGADTEIYMDFCAACGLEVEMLSLDAAIALSGITAREIVRRTELGTVHFCETASGHLFVCRESLNRSGNY